MYKKIYITKNAYINFIGLDPGYVTRYATLIAGIVPQQKKHDRKKNALNDPIISAYPSWLVSPLT